MNDVGSEAPTTRIAIEGIATIAAFIMVNLAIINLLPIPALDGGRITFILINFLLAKTIRREIPIKIEAYAHMAMLVLLLCLMAFVLVNDIVGLAGHNF